jgi:hypothetical protein
VLSQKSSGQQQQQQQQQQKQQFDCLPGKAIDTASSFLT